MANRKYNHPERLVNKEFESVYHNIAKIDEESQKQRSIVYNKNSISHTTMQENKMYIDKDFNVVIKSNGIVKKFTLTEV